MRDAELYLSRERQKTRAFRFRRCGRVAVIKHSPRREESGASTDSDFSSQNSAEVFTGASPGAAQRNRLRIQAVHLDFSAAGRRDNPCFVLSWDTPTLENVSF